MEWLDKHYLALPRKKKNFLIFIFFSYIILAVIGVKTGIMTIVEGYLIFVVGVVYTEMLKLQYRIKDLETKKKK